MLVVVEEEDDDDDRKSESFGLGLYVDVWIFMSGKVCCGEEQFEGDISRVSERRV